MIAVDTNMLVYAHRTDTPWHERAEALVTQLAETRAPWAIPWPCVHEFVSVVTRRYWVPATPLEVALESAEAWLQSPSLILLSETDDHWRTLKNLVTTARIAGPAVHDARIAAICLQHGVSELLTADRDFSRFPELKTRNPLV